MIPKIKIPMIPQIMEAWALPDIVGAVLTAEAETDTPCSTSEIGFCGCDDMLGFYFVFRLLLGACLLVDKLVLLLFGSTFYEMWEVAIFSSIGRSDFLDLILVQLGTFGR